MTTPQWATPEDIASEREDISAETVRRECRAGRVPGAFKAGRSWLIPLDVAEEFVRTFERYAVKR